MLLAHGVALLHGAAVLFMLTGALLAWRWPRLVLLPDSSVVGAFHHLSAVTLEDLSQPTLDGDVMVVGDTREATDLVQALAGRLPGMRGVYAGRLRNARQVEALTINLVSVNRRYKAHAGIRITDV